MRATGPSVLSRILTIIAQALQLVVVLALLVLWPASLVEGGLGLVRVWQLYAAYFVFFFLGSVLRVVRFGKFAPGKQDKQVGGRGHPASSARTCPLGDADGGHMCMYPMYDQGSGGWCRGLCPPPCSVLLHVGAVSDWAKHCLLR